MVQMLKVSPARPVSTRTLVVSVVVVVAVYFGLLSLGRQRLVVPAAGGHYEYLTDALISGQTHFKVAPDPRLGELENPWAGAQGIPRLHDATYYHGKYYLYFGIGPALLLLIPWRLLTGSFLTDGGAVLVFCCAALVCVVAIWRTLQMRYWPQLPRWRGILAVMVLGLGNHIIFLLQGTQFYQIASSSAYFCLSAALLFLIWATLAAPASRQPLFLILASVFWGLSVASRPNFIFTLPALGLALASWWWRGWQKGVGIGQLCRVAAAMCLPVTLIGVGLGYYNWIRFGTPLEFGIRYQFAAGDMRFIKLAGLEFVPTNFVTYLTAGCAYLRYFPWVQLQEPVFGIIPWAPAALGVLLLPLVAWMRPCRNKQEWGFVAGPILAAVLLNFAGLLIYAFPFDRYALDFIPLAIMGALLVWTAASQAASAGLRRLAAVGGTIVLLWTAAHSVLLTIGSPSFAKPLITTARLLNYPAHLWERSAGVRFGAANGTMVFRAANVGTREPILSTGRGRDVLFAEHSGVGRVRFGFIHSGTQAPLGEEMEFEPGREYRWQADLGSLYPPIQHPIWTGVNPSIVHAFQRRVSLRVDDRQVYETSSAFYPSSEGLVRVGATELDAGVSPKFSGEIHLLGRAGIPEAILASDVTTSGPVRLTVKFPVVQSAIGEPLVSTGAKGEGDVVFVTYLAPGRIRLGLDSARGGAVETRALRIDPHSEHIIDVDLPALHGDVTDGQQHAGRVCLNGQLVLRVVRPFPQGRKEDTVFGFNAAGSTAASMSFSGPVFRVAPHRSTAFDDPGPVSWGPVRLTLAFPEGRVRAQEPLLTTGVAGAGNFVYVVYVDPQHIQIGYDHWGIGGVLSEPVRVDYKAVNSVEISIGSLYPPEKDSWWSRQSGVNAQDLRQRVWVNLNEAVVLDKTFAAHPTVPETFKAGLNVIGGSTCSEKFGGEIHRAENISPGVVK